MWAFDYKMHIYSLTNFYKYFSPSTSTTRTPLSAFFIWNGFPSEHETHNKTDVGWKNVTIIARILIHVIFISHVHLDALALNSLVNFPHLISLFLLHLLVTFSFQNTTTFLITHNNSYSSYVTSLSISFQ